MSLLKNNQHENRSISWQNVSKSYLHGTPKQALLVMAMEK